MKNTSPKITLETQPKKKLSPWRVLLVLGLVAMLCYGAIKAWQAYAQYQADGALEAWFAPYVDVTSTPTYAFEQLAVTATPNVILAFIVSSHEDACTPSWGGAYTFDQASANLDLDRRIARFRQQGGHAAISFGGLLNDELSLKCTDQNKLLAAYQSVIDRYEISTIDLDLEGDGLTNTEASKRRAAVLAQLQKQRKEEGKNLGMWLTLPVTPQGLTQTGTDAVAQFLAAGIDLAGVNAMTMDYGQSREPKQTMQEAAEQALVETHRQLGILYQQAGKNLSDASLWRKVAATPMLGQNDILEEVFTIEDAIGLNSFVSAKGIIRLSMWSANRDVQCSDNYVNVSVVSDSCSGIEQTRFAFARALSKGLNSTITQNSKQVTVEDLTVNRPEPDNPDESPYQIWQESGTYLEGTKVVWHRHVYQAKWWTQGDPPDDPVLQSWQIPWKLIGPVLPGEKPVPPTTLPPGTYPAWQGTAIYDAGQRVLFNGIPYQAKWWTQGDSPAAAMANPNSSPWLPLSEDQIKRLKSELKNRK